ncbi:hypothetical protein TWF481_000790 [Arthrobotrys musiformis]|uniref:Uncharacterized protein n=1 Tax=Arthrobotrys musiformis TaxID=47236 RepID=A0AAV9WNT5_9PEZI
MASQVLDNITAQKQLFFNLPQRNGTVDEKSYFGPVALQTVPTNWRTFEDQPLTKSNIIDLFANRIPVVRQKNFLNQDELNKMLEIVKAHELGEYDTEFTWPRVGTSGITQYDHIKDPQSYFDKAPGAWSLQTKWKSGAGIDVVERVIEVLRKATGMPVRLANEGEQDYFAGILRAIDRGIGVHADYAPYEAANWSIDKIVGQLTWNILLNEIPGGDTLVYDRQWVAPDDDEAWRKIFPRDSYHPQMLEGHPFKAMRALPGDLTFFNPRNFHEVKACDTNRDHPVAATRLTVSSFVGYMPAQNGEPATLVLWS